MHERVTFYRPVWWIGKLRQNFIHRSDIFTERKKILHELFSHAGPLRTLSGKDEVDLWDRFEFSGWRDDQRCPRL